MEQLTFWSGGLPARTSPSPEREPDFLESAVDWPSTLSAWLVKLHRAGFFGYHLAYRILDAQFFVVHQRRRRVFLVGYFGDWRPPVAVLFEPHGLRRDTSQGRKTRHVFPCLTRRGATAYDDRTPYVLEKTGVRIATPKEWERLFGFPDDYTLVPYEGKPAADSPRYKALGNSMAVPVMRWIGERIQKWEDMYADGTGKEVAGEPKQ